MVDEITLAISIAAIVIAIAGIVPLYLDYFDRRSQKHLEKEVTFEVERFQESVTSPVESLWSIRILNPSQTLEHCSVSLYYPSRENSGYIDQRVYLPVWSRKDVYIESKISKGGAANFRIPKTVNPFGSFVQVQNRDELPMRLREFRDIPETTA